jgi:hypothetical protein
MSDRFVSADEHPSTAAMKIGDLVLYQGRSYYLRGLDPIGVPNRQAFLEDPSSGDELVVPVEEIASEPANGASV